MQKTVSTPLGTQPENKRPRQLKTESGIEIKPVYGPSPQGTDNAEIPGEFPYTRGIHRKVDPDNPFKLRQYVGFGTVEETNQLFRYLVSQGQNVISVAYDLPTQLGYDSDDPRVAGTVGTIGIPVCTLADWEGVFDGIDFKATKVSSVCNAQSPVALAWHLASAERRGLSPKHLQGVVQNDILKEFIARGNYIFPPEQSMRLTIDVVEYAVRHLPKYTPLYLCCYHIREAGADAIQELAFGFASGIAYLEASLKRGLDIDNVAPKIPCLMTCRHRDFFEEVAKFRAARRIWARLMRERFGSKNPQAQKLTIMQYQGGNGFTAEQKEINIARAAMAAMAGAMGGVQDMGLCTMDEALGIPSEKSLTIALRTCQIVGHETGVTHTMDPLGGSYYIEHLTDAIEKEVGVYLDKIDAKGGMLNAVIQGYPQRKISETDYAYQRAEENGTRIIVGRNRFVSDEEIEEANLYQQNEEILKLQVAKLKKIRQNRSVSALKKSLDQIRKIAQKHAEGGKNNLVLPIIEAVKAYATVGEICGVLREEWGTHQEEIHI